MTAERKKRCLIVDDEPIVLEGTKRILERDGWEVITESNAQEALKRIDRGDFDLLLLDIVMPGASGEELLPKFKQADPNMAIVIMTGYPDVKSAVTCLTAGAAHYLAKPFTPKELLDAIAKAEEKELKGEVSVPKQASKTRPSWYSEYQKKVCTPAEAAELVKSGMSLYISANAATPFALERALADRAHELEDVKVIHVLLSGKDYLRSTSPDSPFRHVSLFVGPADRESVNAGRSEYVPVFLYEIPSLFSKKLIPIDIAFLHVSPPDEHGFMSLGVECLASLAAAEHAKIVVAQVNENMPYTLGDCFIHYSMVDRIVEVSDDITELVNIEPTEKDRRIGAYIADLIDDGACLQLGIGAIPNAVLSYLEGKRDLGIHTEMISDGLLTAIEKGIITGARKTIHRNKVIGTFIYGSRKLYDFVHKNPMIELHPVDYTNRPSIIARNDNMVAINSAIEIDITGQVCSDSIGTRIYSGFGGQVDFVRGARAAKGGKPIIAIQSTTKDGKRSKIVPKLQPGAGVVTTRADVHYVVTEYGVAFLHGKSLCERAKELIRIAHPDHKEALIREAKERKLL